MESWAVGVGRPSGALNSCRGARRGRAKPGRRCSETGARGGRNISAPPLRGGLGEGLLGRGVRVTGLRGTESQLWETRPIRVPAQS